jgi:hypothetical protein
MPRTFYAYPGRNQPNTQGYDSLDITFNVMDDIDGTVDSV